MLHCLIPVLSVCTLACCGAVSAQEFPTRPLRIVTAAVGGAIDLVALLGGEVQMPFATSSSVAAHIKSGKLRALAIGTAMPSALAASIEAEMTSLGKVIKAAGIHTN